MKRAWAVTRKEWAEVFKNRFVIFTVAFMPLLLTAIPLIILGVTGSAEGMSDLNSADMPPSFSALCTDMTGQECAQYFLVSQFLLLFMLIPLAIPVTIATYSVVGEKTTRTLEPVLATPITTAEFLAGKALAAILPAIAATWGAFLVFVIGSAALGAGAVLRERLTDPLWLAAIFAVGPLMALASVNVALMVSSRANDPRVAEQLSMLVMLPLLGLFFGQITGLVIINIQVILWMGLALLVIDAGLIAFAVQLFQRESILTRWK
jgi:ABC-2 type transport system permease protein